MITRDTESYVETDDTSRKVTVPVTMYRETTDEVTGEVIRTEVPLVLTAQIAIGANYADADILLDTDTGSGELQFLFLEDEAHTAEYIPDELGTEDTASLGLPDGVFTGTYYGFLTLRGKQYFARSERFTDEGQLTSYRMLTMVPVKQVYATRGAKTLTLAGMAILEMLLLLVLCAVSFADGGIRPEHAGNGETNPDKRLNTALKLTLYALVFAGLGLYVYFSGRTDDPSSLALIVSQRHDRGLNIFTSVEVLSLIVGAGTLSNLLSLMTQWNIPLLTGRAETLLRLAASIAKYCIAMFCMFNCLYLLGMDTHSVLTSLGVFSAIIGLGANKLIGDIVAGIFLIFEGEFRVGDIVTIAGFCGRVKEIGIRTTKLENLDGNVQIFTNSAITGILNMTRANSCVILTLNIDPEKPVEEVENIIERCLPQIDSACGVPHTDLKYMGVDVLSAGGNLYRVEARCPEAKRNALYRSLNRALYRMCRENGLKIM